MKVTWDQDTCIHAGNCVQGLPEVFKIEDGQFVITQDGASEDAIRKQVGECPSNALKIDEQLSLTYVAHLASACEMRNIN